MCLVVKSGPHRAKSDIKVLKVLTPYNRGPYYGFIYHPNSTYRLRKKLVAVNGLEGAYIHQGFHSFAEQINVVLPSHLELDCKIVQMIIPKGATYYIGERGELVSTSLRTGDLTGLSHHRGWRQKK